MGGGRKGGVLAESSTVGIQSWRVLSDATEDAECLRVGKECREVAVKRKCNEKAGAQDRIGNVNREAVRFGGEGGTMSMENRMTS